jgi:hypothetical protein
VKTVTITTGGQIADTDFDPLEFDTMSGVSPDIIQVSDGVFTIAYVNSSQS